MTITDELREWARNNTVQDKVLTTYPVQHPVHGTVESLLRIADRIDTEHEHEMEERADRYSELRAKMNNCYIELPKDADGEPVHVGDMMECEKLPNGNRVCGEVKAIGDGYVWLTNVPYKINAEYLHHRHPDTWERVIRDAIMRGADIQWKTNGGSRMTDYFVPEDYDLVARCKALAGDAE